MREWFGILRVGFYRLNTVTYASAAKVITADTRSDVYDQLWAMLRQSHPEMQGAVTDWFYAEPQRT